MIRAFGPNEVWFILAAVQWTLALSAIAFAGGTIGGLLTALARVSKSSILSGFALGFIRLFQGTPLLMQLFLVFFGLSITGYGINPWVAAGLALVAGLCSLSRLRPSIRNPPTEETQDVQPAQQTR